MPSKNTNNYESPNKVGIIFSDAKREYFPTEEQYITEKDAKKDAETVAFYINGMGIKVKTYPGDSELANKLTKDKPDLVINLVDSVKGMENLASSIPGVLEILEIPYTGTDTLGMSIGSSKFLVKKLFQQSGIPVPNHQLVSSPSEYLNPTLRYPLISKLDEIHGAVEITEDSVSENEKHLRDRLKSLINTYKQPVIVEEFIEGREVTGILLEGLNKKVYIAEKVFTKSEPKYTLATFEDQWIDEDYNAFHYKKYEDSILKEYIKKAFDVSKMYDYGKFDIRIDSSGRYFFIDSNCNPAFGPKELNVAISVILDLYGVSFVKILKRLMINTVRDAKGKERLPVPGDF